MLDKLIRKIRMPDNSVSNSKLPYASPTLIVHGKVKELTAAGSGFSSERKRGKGSAKKRA